jgi:hypothetical protein
MRINPLESLNVHREVALQSELRPLRIGRPVWLAVACVGLGLIAAACGGGSSPGVASVGSTTTTTTSPSSARASYVLFSRCMRTHGVADFPNPIPGPGGGFTLPAGSPSLKNNPQFRAASQACSKDLPGGGPAGKLKRISVQKELKFASCMRAHGITDFPDPLPGGGFYFPNSLETTTPRFEAAESACSNKAGVEGVPIASNSPSNAP